MGEVIGTYLGKAMFFVAIGAVIVLIFVPSKKKRQSNEKEKNKEL